MSKLFLRIVALVLMPCLIADAGLAAISAKAPQSPGSPTTADVSLFREQAIPAESPGSQRYGSHHTGHGFFNSHLSDLRANVILGVSLIRNNPVGLGSLSLQGSASVQNRRNTGIATSIMHGQQIVPRTSSRNHHGRHPTARSLRGNQDAQDHSRMSPTFSAAAQILETARRDEHRQRLGRRSRISTSLNSGSEGVTAVQWEGRDLYLKDYFPYGPGDQQLEINLEMSRRGMIPHIFHVFIPESKQLFHKFWLLETLQSRGIPFTLINKQNARTVLSGLGYSIERFPDELLFQSLDLTYLNSGYFNVVFENVGIKINKAFSLLKDHPEAQIRVMENLGRLLAATHNEGWVLDDAHYEQYVVAPDLTVRRVDTARVHIFEPGAPELTASREAQLRDASDFLTELNDFKIFLSGFGSLAEAAFLLSYYETLELPAFNPAQDHSFGFLSRVMQTLARRLEIGPSWPFRQQTLGLLERWTRSQGSTAPDDGPPDASAWGPRYAVWAPLYEWVYSVPILNTVVHTIYNTVRLRDGILDLDSELPHESDLNLVGGAMLLLVWSLTPEWWVLLVSTIVGSLISGFFFCENHIWTYEFQDRDRRGRIDQRKANWLTAVGSLLNIAFYAPFLWPGISLFPNGSWWGAVATGILLNVSLHYLHFALKRFGAFPIWVPDASVKGEGKPIAKTPLSLEQQIYNVLKTTPHSWLTVSQILKALKLNVTQTIRIRIISGAERLVDQNKATQFSRGRQGSPEEFHYVPSHVRQTSIPFSLEATVQHLWRKDYRRLRNSFATWPDWALHDWQVLKKDRSPDATSERVRIVIRLLALITDDSLRQVHWRINESIWPGLSTIYWTIEQGVDEWTRALESTEPAGIKVRQKMQDLGFDVDRLRGRSAGPAFERFNLLDDEREQLLVLLKEVGEIPGFLLTRQGRYTLSAYAAGRLPQELSEEGLTLRRIHHTLINRLERFIELKKLQKESPHALQHAPMHFLWTFLGGALSNHRRPVQRWANPPVSLLPYFETIGDVLRMSVDELRGSFTVSDKKVAHVREVLATFGVSLRGDIPPDISHHPVIRSPALLQAA